MWYRRKAAHRVESGLLYARKPQNKHPVLTPEEDPLNAANLLLLDHDRNTSLSAPAAPFRRFSLTEDRAITECKVPEGEVFLGGGCTDPAQYEQPEDYWCYCDVCGEKIPEDWTSTCWDCFHLPMRRPVWGRLDKPDRDGNEYGWTYSNKNWQWVPYGDGSGEGEIVKGPVTDALLPYRQESVRM